MFSSSPTVETKYPLAQKCSPVKFFCRPPNFRAIWIALFPFRYPHRFPHFRPPVASRPAPVLAFQRSPFPLTRWPNSLIPAANRTQPRASIDFSLSAVLCARGANPRTRYASRFAPSPFQIKPSSPVLMRHLADGRTSPGCKPQTLQTSVCTLTLSKRRARALRIGISPGRTPQPSGSCIHAGMSRWPCSTRQTSM